jgi:hypothetical protein
MSRLNRGATSEGRGGGVEGGGYISTHWLTVGPQCNVRDACLPPQKGRGAGEQGSRGGGCGKRVCDVQVPSPPER